MNDLSQRLKRLNWRRASAWRLMHLVLLQGVKLKSDTFSKFIQQFLSGILCAVCALSIFASPLAFAELTIVIDKGIKAATPIAIVPFEWRSSAQQTEDVASIVDNNLLISGLFSAMERDNMLSLPGVNSKIFFRDWRLSSMDYLVVGEVTDSDEINQLQINFKLFDVINGRELLNSSVNTAPNQLRIGAHKLSNQIYEKITGIEGVFDTRILYVGDEQINGKSKYKLLVSDQDGKRASQIITSDEPLMSPTWSPDAKQVAYVSFETGRAAIFSQELATGKRQQLTNFVGINGSPNWSPDGKKLAMVLSKDGNPEIYVLTLATGKFSRITNHFSIDTEPNWTPDGKHIIFTSDRGGKPQIYKVNIGTKKTERITFRGDYNARSRLSRDGRYLVMVHGKGNKFHVAVQDLETDKFLIVTETTQDESPSIAPNGAMVMYATKEKGKGILGVVSLDAGIRYHLPAKSFDAREPAWSPNIVR